MLKEKIIGKIIGFLYDLYSSTLQYELLFTHPQQKREITENLLTRETLEKSFLIASFHQDDAAVLKKFAHRNIGIMVSPSKDGEILAQVCNHLGYQLIRGSSNKKAIASVIASLKFLKKGHRLAIAVDGPRGPYGDVKEGIIRISEKTKCPIIPIAVLPNSYWEFSKAWNKPRLPKPFAKVRVLIGEKRFYQREELKNCILSMKKQLMNKENY